MKMIFFLIFGLTIWWPDCQAEYHIDQILVYMIFYMILYDSIFSIYIFYMYMILSIWYCVFKFKVGPDYWPNIQVQEVESTVQFAFARVHAEAEINHRLVTCMGRVRQRRVSRQVDHYRHDHFSCSCLPNILSA